jgi:DNA-binding transcriptional regulator YiaG
MAAGGGVIGMSAIRACRVATNLSQAAFAERLGVGLESYRTWDAGRREPPPEVLAAAEVLAATGAGDRPMPLPALARVLAVSVFRLREAARDGRLAVTYERRVMFGHPIPRATRAAGEAYKRQFYGKRARWVARPTPPPRFAAAPPDFDRRLRDLRRRLALSQTQLAHQIGAAGKAVIYQWESRRRRPSPVLWQRIGALVRATEVRRASSDG